LGGRKEKEGEDGPPSDLRERIATLEVHVEWIRQKLDLIDKRTWWILGSVVALGLIAILIAVLKP